MKTIISIITLLILSTDIYSQQIKNDTLFSTSIKSNWAFRMDMGVRGQNIFSQQDFDLAFSPAFSLSVYYKNFFFSYGVYQFEHNSEKIDIITDNLDLALGYNYDFLNKWSSDIRAGFNATSLWTFKKTYTTNNDNKSEILNGALLGIGINRYFKLKRFNYLALRFGLEYFTTNYSTVWPDLENGSINYSLTLAYKGWFRKSIH